MNYRISPPKRVVENTFGTCASRFSIFRRSIIASVNIVTSFTKVVVAVHNYLNTAGNFDRKTITAQRALQMAIGGMNM